MSKNLGALSGCIQSTEISCNLSIRPALVVRGGEILDDGAEEGNRDSIEKERQFLSFLSLPFRFSLGHFSQKHLILWLVNSPFL